MDRPFQLQTLNMVAITQPRKARERNNLLCHYFGYYFPQTFVKSVIIIRSYQTYYFQVNK